MSRPINPGATTEVLRGMYAAELEYLSAGGPGEASFDLLAPFFAADVVLHQADGLPYGGTWRGHQGLERFFLAMSATWESFQITEQRILSTDGPAVVLSAVEARAAATGRELSFPILQTLEVSGGQIQEVRPYYWDTLAIAEATTARAA
jgi:ketosteroid isomerase-like protein